MITCCIRYTVDPPRLPDFEEYARRWPPIIARCGGRLIGYFLPKEGANNFALALIDFDSLAAYEAYRAKLAADYERMSAMIFGTAPAFADIMASIEALEQYLNAAPDGGASEQKSAGHDRVD